MADQGLRDGLWCLAVMDLLTKAAHSQVAVARTVSEGLSEAVLQGLWGGRDLGMELVQTCAAVVDLHERAADGAAAAANASGGALLLAPEVVALLTRLALRELLHAHAPLSRNSPASTHDMVASMSSPAGMLCSIPGLVDA
ncbi:unnamed protein product, partial [Chrysoparadoxa australica]